MHCASRSKARSGVSTKVYLTLRNGCCFFSSFGIQIEFECQKIEKRVEEKTHTYLPEIYIKHSE